MTLSMKFRSKAMTILFSMIHVVSRPAVKQN